MDAIYLLLRNNRQTGPLPLTELVQQDLRPTDLIWVEGKSASWSFPSELAELTPYLSPKESTVTAIDTYNCKPANHTTSKSETASNSDIHNAAAPHIYVSLPASKRPANNPAEYNSLEEQAVALKQKVQQYVAEHQQQEVKPVAPISPVTIEELENKYVGWQHKHQQQQTSRHHRKTVMATVAALVLLGVGYVLAKNEILSRKTNAAAILVKKELHSESAQTAKSYTKPPVEPMDSEADISMNYNIPVGENTPVPATAVATKKKKAVSKPAIKIPVPAIPQPGKDVDATMPPPLTSGDINIAKTDNEVETTTEKRTQTLGKKISGFFKKIGGKKSKGGDSNKDQNKNEEEKGTIKISLLNNNEDVKVSLHNSKDQPIKNAIVELRFYNAKNELVGKRLLQFSNIAANNNAILSVANPPVSDHTLYELVMAH